VDDAQEQKVWIFQANPKTYDLLDFLARPSTHPGIVDDWALRQHAKNVLEGDTVLLWTAGKQARIYATGTVVGESFMRPRQDWEPEDAPQESLTIHFRLDRILDHPVLRRDLVNHPILKDLSVIRQSQGTNFPVTEQQWEALRPLIEPLNPDAAYFILNQRE
jgi:5-methylcytosine-specific restriction protein B